MKQKYLVIQTEWFYDAHGEADEGETKKFISDNDIYEGLKEGVYYDSNLEEICEDNDEVCLDILGDGYSCTETSFAYKKITEEESIEIQKIIEQYNNLKI